MKLQVMRPIPVKFAGKAVKVGDIVDTADMSERSFGYYVREGFLFPAPGEPGYVPVAPRPRGRPRKPDPKPVPRPAAKK